MKFLPNCLFLFAFLACRTLLIDGPSALAHGPNSDHEHPHDGETKQASLPTAMVLPQIDGPKPWSNKPVLNDPERFQIAIMTDRTGGHRPGIWMDAVRKLNILRPEFVVSVGDLIEGYTEDRDEIEREWREFLGFIGQMEMKFFFVAGNHDLTNPVMHEIWRQKFGREWYSFDYKSVHFVCVCSEDPVDRIGDRQLTWIEQDLAEHADARWTLVFLHKPLWVYAEQEMAAGNGDPTNWKQVERLLADRPHTVFAGHVHHYVAYQRNSRDYYTLATTGGGSQLRGNEYGEFDHVTWLTMERDGLHLANLRLDGILPPDVVTEESIARFRKFLEQTVVEVAPILIDNENGFGAGEIHVRVRNGFDENVTVAGAINGLPLRGLTVDPEQFALSVPVGQTAEKSIHVRFEKPVEFPSLAQTTFTAKIATTGEAPLRAERLAPVVIDQRFICPQVAQVPDVDGQIADLPGRMIQFPEKPLVIGNAASWTGPGDSTAEFSTACDDENLYVAVKVTDENVLSSNDLVRLLVDTRPVDKRRGDTELGEGALSIVASAPNGQPTNVRAMRLGRGRRPLRGVAAAGTKTDTGYDVEFSIPLRAVKEAQGDDWHSVQMTVVVLDADERGQRPAQVLWRGTESALENNVGYGHVVREGARRTQDDTATLFNGKDLTGWTGNPNLWSVENGEIVGKTASLKRNEWLVSDLAAEDFHLTLEVKLVDNQGNSGIQFRSEALPDGEVKGYQADIGAGWWGKLYEEHGRALLWDKSGEKYVKKGDWNKYEIIARGSHIVTKINGHTCVDLDDPKGARRGIFAPQLHSGGATEVRFRNLKLEVFDDVSEEQAHADRS